MINRIHIEDRFSLTDPERQLFTNSIAQYCDIPLENITSLALNTLRSIFIKSEKQVAIDLLKSKISSTQQPSALKRHFLACDLVNRCIEYEKNRRINLDILGVSGDPYTDRRSPIYLDAVLDQYGCRGLGAPTADLESFQYPRVYTRPPSFDD